jgi:uncharacterized protein (TIGR02118 family)
MVFFRRPDDETLPGFGDRLRALAEKVASDPSATTVILHVQDDRTGAPPGASFEDRDFDASITVGGLGREAVPDGDAVYAVRRRVIKAQPRGEGGARTPGFTIVCPSKRAPHLSHEEFDAHWRDRHAPIHVASSPGTCHYEQYTVDEVATPGAPALDGFGWLSFASAESWETGLFDGEAGQQAIFDDIPRFLDPSRFATFAATEYVYRDQAASGPSN